MSYPAQDPDHQPWDDPEVWAQKLAESEEGKREAILNIQMAEGRVMRVWEWTQNEELNEAIADLQQAVRFLTGEETPS